MDTELRITKMTGGTTTAQPQSSTEKNPATKQPEVGSNARKTLSRIFEITNSLIQGQELDKIKSCIHAIEDVVNLLFTTISDLQISPP
ncbi:hypothetical protein BDZ45DRAFT_76511 [Acephala macrosclerotiorum]|nr:hypothetical protein BDZ45DRAFT_76511 [Acephala macrosclerotiorum]